MAQLNSFTLLKRPFSIARRVFFRFSHEGFSDRTAALAFMSLLAIVPLMLIALRVLAVFPAFDGAGAQIELFVLKNFVPTSSDKVIFYLDSFLKRAATLPPLALVLLILSAVFMLYQINGVFNAIWRIKHRLHLSLSFLLYVFVLFLLPVLLASGLVLSAGFMRLPYVASFFAMSGFESYFFLILPYALILITFILFNWLLPTCSVRWLYAVIGGVVTTVIFELAKFGFTVYIAHVQTYQILYGALAVLPVFMLWIYISWMIVLLGALVTHDLFVSSQLGDKRSL